MPPLNWFEEFIVAIALAHVGFVPEALDVLALHDPGPYGRTVRSARDGALKFCGNAALAGNGAVLFGRQVRGLA